jgi:hypothetical protein
MDKTPALSVGQILIGSLFNEPMRVETVHSNGFDDYVFAAARGLNDEYTLSDYPSIILAVSTKCSALLKLIRVEPMSNGGSLQTPSHTM